jgi:hypothetical protein
MRQDVKTEQIQLRVTRAEKRDLERRSREEGLDLSAWMLGRLRPPHRIRFWDLVSTLAASTVRSFVLAEVGELLLALASDEFSRVTEGSLPAKLDELTLNQLAAMVELRAARLGVEPPAWTKAVVPLCIPWFASALLSVRLHLLCNAPPAYRRRNLFVDSTFEERV